MSTNIFIRLEGPFGDWRDDLGTLGYAVVKGAIPLERAQAYQAKALDWLRSFDSSLDFAEPSTWKGADLPVQTKLNTYQHYSVAHERFMWEARMESGVLEAFAKIWSTDELLVSFDSLNVTLPNLKPVRDPWPHIDQAPRKRGLHCVQGIINLSSAGPDDGSLVVIPGSHKYTEEFFDTQTDASTWAWKDNRYFDDEDMAWFSSRGLEPMKVLAEPGDLIVWDSRTIHWGGEPTPGKSNVIRTVIYAAYAPASMASQQTLEEKRRVFEAYGATTHWPHDNVALRDLQARLFNGTLDPRHRSEPLEKAVQTDQLLRLAGVKAY